MRLATGVILFMFIGVALSACASKEVGAAPSGPGFAIRLVDESVDSDSTTGPPGSDRFPNFMSGSSGAHWLEREGGVEGELADVSVARRTGVGNVVNFTLTPRGRDQLAELMRNNIGRWSAIVVQGKVVVTGLMNGVITEGELQISGAFTEAEANMLADAMRAVMQCEP